MAGLLPAIDLMFYGNKKIAGIGLPKILRLVKETNDLRVMSFFKSIS
jgi:hypothetical protein